MLLVSHQLINKIFHVVTITIVVNALLHNLVEYELVTPLDVMCDRVLSFYGVTTMNKRNHLPTFPTPYLTSQFLPQAADPLHDWITKHAPESIRVLWNGYTSAVDLIQETAANDAVHYDTWHTSTVNIGNALHVLYGSPITEATP